MTFITAGEITGEATRACRDRHRGRRGRPKVWPPKIIAEARALREIGVAYRTIARSLGVSQKAVWVWCQSPSFAA